MSELKTTILVYLRARMRCVWKFIPKTNSNLTRFEFVNVRLINISYRNEYMNNLNTKDFYEICMLGQKTYEFREAI